MKTIVINWGALTNFGGIERINYYLIKFMSENGVRVIWLKSEKSVIGEAFKDIVYHKNVEIVNVSENHLYWFKHERVSISKAEQVVVVSYTVFDMIRSLSLKNQLKGCDVSCIYTIPDTTGNFFFIERYFKGWLKKIVFNRIKKTLSDWNDAGIIFFCAPLQITSFENNYHITVDTPQDKLIKAVYAPTPLKEDELSERSKRAGKFNIITVGRFVFPHKGYILGLIKAFGRLKPKYPQLTLTIIGKGRDEQMLRDAISVLDEYIRKDIHVIGEVAHTQLPFYYRDKHLSIAVAGSSYDAAKNGVLSLVARNHFKEECEVYGYFDENKDMNVAITPGTLVDTFIEDAIKMSEQEYRYKCKRAFDAIATNPDNIAKPWLYFDAVDHCRPYSMKPKELRQYAFLNYLRKLLLLLHISR